MVMKLKGEFKYKQVRGMWVKRGKENEGIWNHERKLDKNGKKKKGKHEGNEKEKKIKKKKVYYMKKK